MGGKEREDDEVLGEDKIYETYIPVNLYQQIK